MTSTATHTDGGLDAFEPRPVPGYEEVVFARDDDAGYRAFIAVHSTRLGPALGGTRLRAYASDEEALTDVLRLARGMTYKCAAAGLPLGGGKSVLVAPPGPVDRRRLFRAHGRAVDRLGGRYVTSVDIGTGQEDMPYIAETTRHVTGLPEEMRDPARVTARGVLRAMQGALRHVTGTDDPADRTIAIQGCGHVGFQLARQLRDAGARLVVSDVDAERARRVGAELGATVVAADEIYDARADVFAPCAVGAVLDDATIPRLRCAIVAGAANNQLRDDRHGQALHDRGILYVPDFIANAGGATFLCIPLAGWSEERMWAHVERFDQVVAEVLALAARDGLLPHQAAERIAEERLAAGPGSA